LAKPPIYYLIATLLASGCCFQPYRPVTVLVRQEEDGKPILGAEVGVSYHTKFFGPVTSSGRTDEAGKALLFVTPYNNGQHLYADLGHDHLEFLDVSNEQLEAVPWTRWLTLLRFSEARPPDFVIAVTKKPAEP